MSDSLYNVASTIGKFRAWTFLIVGIIISIFFCLIGLFLFFKKDDNPKSYNQTNAEIKTVTCDRNGNNLWLCKMNIEYTANEKKYNINTEKMNNIEYKVGDNIIISYNINAPEDHIVGNPPTNSKFVPYIFSFIALLIICIAYFNWYLTMHNETYSAFSGIQGMFGHYR